jgi:hypothetical protein
VYSAFKFSRKSVRGEYDSSSKIRGHLVEPQRRMAIFLKTALKILIKFKYFYEDISAYKTFLVVSSGK